MMRLGLLASHGGSNLGAIITACRSGQLAMEPVAVIGNNSRAFALERARQAGIPTYHLSGQTHPDPATLDAAMAETLARHGAEMIALAGYMKRLGPITLERWRGRIINIHPSLLPKFGGQGMYGERVHAAVLAAGEQETGVTVHLVTEEYDQGPMIAQIIIPVEQGDTPATLGARVLPQEHALYVATLARIASGELPLGSVTEQESRRPGGGGERDEGRYD